MGKRSSIPVCFIVETHLAFDINIFDNRRNYKLVQSFRNNIPDITWWPVPWLIILPWSTSYCTSLVNLKELHHWLTIHRGYSSHSCFDSRIWQKPNSDLALAYYLATYRNFRESLGQPWSMIPEYALGYLSLVCLHDWLFLNSYMIVHDCFALFSLLLSFVLLCAPPYTRLVVLPLKIPLWLYVMLIGRRRSKHLHSVLCVDW